MKVNKGDTIFIDDRNQSVVLNTSPNGDCQVSSEVGIYWISYELVKHYNKAILRDKLINSILNNK